MKKTENKSLSSKLWFFFTLIFVTLFTTAMAFHILIMVWITFLAGPGPHQAIELGVFQVSGQVVQMNDEYFTLKKEDCNTIDCHMIGEEMRIKKESFDSIIREGDKDVVVTIISQEMLTTPYEAVTQSGMKYFHVYTHSSIGRGKIYNDYGAFSLLLMYILTVVITIGTAYGVYTSRHNLKKVGKIFLLFFAFYVIFFFVGRLILMLYIFQSE